MKAVLVFLAVFCIAEYANYRCMMKTYEDMYDKVIRIYKAVLRDYYCLIDKLTDEEEEEE